MPANHHPRLVVLLALAVLGVSLAWAGTALGVDEAVTGDEPTGEVSIAGSNVTVSSAGENVTVVENLSMGTAVTVSNTDGRITVQTSDGGPLTDQQRADALAIARDNETIQQLLDQMEDSRLSVDPVKRLDRSSAERVSVERVSINTTARNDTQIFTVDSVDDVNVNRSENSVTVEAGESSSNYLEDRAVVRIHDGDGDLVYSADVGLESGHVVDGTDWRDA